MATKPLDFEAVREIALELPGVREGTLHDAPSLKVSGRLLACPALHKSAEPNTIMVRISVEQRPALLRTDPSRYYVTDHYLKYSSVLVRLSEMNRQSLRELLSMSWEFVTAQGKGSKGRARLPA